MKTDLIYYVLNNIAHRKMRNFLTVLSILIGIMTIFTIVSFGMGLKNYVNYLSEMAGADKLFIQGKGIGPPGMDNTFFISKDDYNYVEKIKGVKEVIALYYKPLEIVYKDQRKYYMGAGLNVKKFRFMEEGFNVDLIKGRRLKAGDKDKVILGYLYTVPDKIFKRSVKLGDKVYINGKRFEVVGFYSEIGNPQDDSNIYLSDTEMESLYPEIKDKYSALIIKADKSTSVKELAEKVKEKLRKHRGEKEGRETFFVQTFEDVMKTFTNIINVLNGILFLIALISIIVASVNIMNTMYTSVLERTKEIGIMKAIGAQNKDILFIFIFESFLLGLFGGVIGVLFGYIASSIGGYFAVSNGYLMLKPIFPKSLIVLNILGAIIVSTFAGYFPAKQAALINPAETVRADE